MTTAEQIKKVVREKYGAIATQVGATSAGESAPCCGPLDCGGGDDPSGVITSGLYELGQTEGLPPDALTASLGCGNPTALAELQSGETVLDLDSGGGIDVLLSAKRVGPDGFAYGLDMTDEMLALARKNQQEAGVTNTTFLRGEIEAVPLPDAAVDVIISNCVINLSADKGQVLAEAFRVLRPGGRLAVVRCRLSIRSATRRPAGHGALGRMHRRSVARDRLPEETGRRRFRKYRDRADPHLFR